MFVYGEHDSAAKKPKMSTEIIEIEQFYDSLFKKTIRFDVKFTEKTMKFDGYYTNIDHFFTQNLPETLSRGFLGTGNPNLKELFHFDHSISSERPSMIVKNYQNR